MLADTSTEVVLGMLFFPLSDVDMGLQRACLEELHNAEVMPLVAIRRVEFVEGEYAAVVPDESLLHINASESFEKPAWDLLAIRFPLLNFRPPQLIMYTS